jgi:hypothetical protein
VNNPQLAGGIGNGDHLQGDAMSVVAKVDET